MKYRYAAGNGDCLLLSCPHCRKAVKVPESNLGLSLRCGHCQQEFLAPSLPAAELRKASLRSRPKDVVIALALFSVSLLLVLGECLTCLRVPAHTTAGEVVFAGAYCLVLLLVIGGAVIVGFLWLFVRGSDKARLALIGALFIYFVGYLFAPFPSGVSRRLMYLVLISAAIGSLYNTSVKHWCLKVKRLTPL